MIFTTCFIANKNTPIKRLRIFFFCEFKRLICCKWRYYPPATLTFCTDTSNQIYDLAMKCRYTNTVIYGLEIKCRYTCNSPVDTGVRTTSWIMNWPQEKVIRDSLLSLGVGCPGWGPWNISLLIRRGLSNGFPVPDKLRGCVIPRFQKSLKRDYFLIMDSLPQ